MGTITIGSARSDENGKLSGGAAGDQKQTSTTNDTKGEVSMQSMYAHSKTWLVFRPKNTDVAEKIATEMTYACNNANIGYDQGQRGTLLSYVKKNKIKSLKNVAEKVECDCSSLVRTVLYLAAGVDTDDFNTASEPDALKASGLFAESFAYSSQAKTPVYNGDVLVTKTKGHTAAVVSGNPRASTAKSTTTTKGATQKTYYAKYTGSGTSIVDALAAAGESDTSKTHRTKIAAANGISDYTGTAAQNMAMLALIKAGKLVKA